MVSQSQSEETEDTHLIQNSVDSLGHRNYQAADPTYEWNVEIDVKGQVYTGGYDTCSDKFSFRKLLQYTGPGWLISAAYLDPGNLESDLQSGAIAGCKLLWLLFWAHAAGLAIQILSAKLGIVTQNHLAQLIRKNYNRPTSTAIWLFTQLAIIGSDIQEIIGTAIAIKIIFGLRLWVGVLITASDTFLFMWLQQYGVRKIEVFFMTLIGIMIGCFWVELFVSKPNIEIILKGILIPDIPQEAKVQAVGMVGAVIMPHNMFLHSALVMSRNLGENPTNSKKKEANFYFAIESGIALFMSYLINLAVVVVFAQAYYRPDQTLVELPGLFDASEVLARTFGKSAKYLWALGLLAAGQSSTMTGTMAGQYVVEGFLGSIFKEQWHRVALTRAVALVPSMLVAVLAVDHFDTMGEFLNVLQSLCLPTAIIPILKLTASTEIMTKLFRNSKLTNVVCWLISLIVIGFNVHLFVNYLSDLDWPLYAVVFSIIYFTFILYLVYIPLVISKTKKAEEEGLVVG